MGSEDEGLEVLRESIKSGDDVFGKKHWPMYLFGYLGLCAACVCGREAMSHDCSQGKEGG